MILLSTRNEFRFAETHKFFFVFSTTFVGALILFFLFFGRFIRQIRDKLSDQESALREELQQATSALEVFQQVRDRWRFLFSLKSGVVVDDDNNNKTEE